MDGMSAARPTWSRTEWVGIGLLLLVAAVTLLFELDDSHTFGSHEVFVAVPAREMLSTGNWIVPTYGHLPRLEKPPLAYWVAAGSGWLLGEVNEWTARLPSALAAAALAALMGWWARRWYGRAAGFGAALAQLTSVWVLTWGRKAEVDMLLCLLTTASLFLAAEPAVAESSSRRRLWDARWIGIYSLLGLAWLAKFHYGPAMVLAPVVVFFVLAGHRGDWKHLLNPIGLLIFAAAVIVWPWLVLRQLPEAWSIWTQQTVGRALGQMGREPVWFYLPQLLALSLPWTPVALLAVGESWRRAWKQQDRHERFLWIWLLVQLAILTASSDKHPNYLLASLPVVSLWAGCGFAKLVAAVEAGRLRLSGRHAAVLVGLALIGTAIAWAVGSAKKPTAAESITSLAMVIAAGALLLAWLLWRGRAVAAGLALLLVFLASDAIVVGRILPQVDHRFAAAQF
ncbi:MAG: phospholipid carrier-dependent glycosyltransferase, partial [Planctomycetes bacterium]|nr:phospholipid carrier-dependent glycosyltransferase [Planctomycetota bacterium]